MNRQEIKLIADGFTKIELGTEWLSMRISHANEHNNKR